MKPIRPWKLTYEPRATPAEWLASASKYRVAIIREEGSNGECEVVVRVAGFEPWDVHVRDLLSGRITLEGFLFRVLVGGFSYAKCWSRHVDGAQWAIPC